MHLGVERSRIGDIRIDGQTYYIFCLLKQKLLFLAHTHSLYIHMQTGIMKRIQNILDYDIPVEFPITCLTFSPSHLKFAEDLTHRDILGALMHLGVSYETGINFDIVFSPC